MTRRVSRLKALAVAMTVAACAQVATPARSCLEGLSSCSGSCLDLARDPGNCGACGNACASGETCSSGRCSVRCQEPATACPTLAADACVDLSSDASNCGVCGNACPTGEQCALSVCRTGCTGSGWATCGSACVDTTIDPAHCGACGAACATGQACSSGACVAASSAEAPRLYVSLTADDTFEHQFSVMTPILEAHGMRATLYVNSGRIDLPGFSYLTSPQLALLQELGHEIGSHGLTHQRLATTMTPIDRIRRELCDSRADLLARGLAVRSFAFPFGANDADAQQTAEDCGYVTARDIGSLSPSRGIHSEELPPSDPLALRAASSVGPTTSLDQVKGYVLSAEQAAVESGRPGWLIINFHELCPGAACSTLAWDTELFRQFVAWLAERKAAGTLVRTVSQVVAGPLGPPVHSAERFGTPLVINGDFESALAGDAEPPDCWVRRQSGTHTDAWSRVAGRSGSAQQVVVSGYTSGTATLMQDRGTSGGPDYRSCGTPVTPGHTYTFRCWYRSDVRVAFTLYRNDTSHSVTAWQQSPTAVPSPSAWALHSFTATVPEGFSTVFFGPQLSSVCESGCLAGPGTATLIVDDCSAEDDG